MKNNQIQQIPTETILTKVTKALKLDGWSNVLTSIGIKGKDKRLSAEVNWKRGYREKFEHFYSADDVAGNIVDIVPEDAFSKGYKITGIEDKDLHDKVMARAKELKVDERFLEAAKLARIHGGAGVIKVTEDAMLDQRMPINKKLLSLSVVDRWDLVVNSTDIDTQITSPTFKEPLRYSLQLSEGSSSRFEKIDASRVIRFDGSFLPRRIMRENQYWGDSILTKLENAIRNYQISHDAAAATVQDFDIPVLKLNNLAEMMTTDCDDAVIKRLEMVNLSRSIAKMIVIDAENETFEHATRNVTGLKDVLDKIESRLVTAAKMPRTKIFGESSGGLGSTGESQQNDWYDLIEAYQHNYLKAKYLEFYRHLIRTEFPQINWQMIDIEFHKLWQMSAKEEADLRKTQADTDAIYLDRQVVDPNEVALSRFGGDKYSPDTIIDKTTREQQPITPELATEVKTTTENLAANDPANKSLEKTQQVKEAALNGAQVTSLQDLVINVQTGALPLETGKELAKIGFGLTDPEITELFKAVKPNSQKPEPAVERFNVKKDHAFEHEFPIYARSGEPLKVQGYKFVAYLKDQKSDDIVRNVATKATDGKIIVFLEKDHGIINDKLDLVITMTSPVGITKTIKKLEAVFSE